MSTEYALLSLEGLTVELWESSSEARLSMSGDAVYLDHEAPRSALGPSMTGLDVVSLSLEALKAASYLIGEDALPDAARAALAGRPDEGYYRSLLARLVGAEPSRPPAPPPTLDEALSVVQGALSRGEVGFAGLMSEHQMDRAGAWSRVCDLLASWEDRGDRDEAHVRELRALVHECADRQTAPVSYAVNTTFYGREAREDHSPS